MRVLFITVNAQKRSKMTIDQMRRAYMRDGLLEKDIHSDPMVQFQTWFDAARQSDLPEWLEVNAMTLSTVNATGGVSSRIVLLKGIEEKHLYFYTNYASDKGVEIGANPSVALCFFWPHLERQVRIEGAASKTDSANSDDYFQSRPRGSRLGAHASRQSAVVASREELDARMAEVEAEYGDNEVPRPEHWGGYEVSPTRFEFWQGRPSRMHDRINYALCDDGSWRIERLEP